MSKNPKPPLMLVGLTRIREHCTFTWQEPEDGGTRLVEVRSHHCTECMAEVTKLGWVLISPGDEEKNG